MTPVEALTQIRDLCDSAERGAHQRGAFGTVRTERIRMILDAVPVDATPAQGIDRDALKDLILWAMHAGLRTDVADVWVERFLALVRPVEGIIITPEEIEAVLVLFGYWDRGAIPAANVADRILALAARLEASS